jgi:hypothetical protein
VEPNADLLVPVWHWSSQFQTVGQVVLRAIHAGKFGAAKNLRELSFGAGAPSLWCRWTDVPITDGFAQKVGPACRAGLTWLVNFENYQGPFRQKGPTTDFLGKADYR